MNTQQAQGNAAALPMHMARAPKPARRGGGEVSAQAAAVLAAAPACAGRTKPSSAADNRHQPVRPGADAGLQLPSRTGDRLHYRSGLVTDMAGGVVNMPDNVEVEAPEGSPRTTG